MESRVVSGDEVSRILYKASGLTIGFCFVGGAGVV